MNGSNACNGSHRLLDPGMRTSAADLARIIGGADWPTARHELTGDLAHASVVAEPSSLTLLATRAAVLLAACYRRRVGRAFARRVGLK